MKASETRMILDLIPFLRDIALSDGFHATMRAMNLAFVRDTLA